MGRRSIRALQSRRERLVARLSHAVCTVDRGGLADVDGKVGGVPVGWSSPVRDSLAEVGGGEVSGGWRRGSSTAEVAKGVKTVLKKSEGLIESWSPGRGVSGTVSSMQLSLKGLVNLFGDPLTLPEDVDDLRLGMVLNQVFSGADRLPLPRQLIDPIETIFRTELHDSIEDGRPRHHHGRSVEPATSASNRCLEEISSLQCLVLQLGVERLDRDDSGCPGSVDRREDDVVVIDQSPQTLHDLSDGPRPLGVTHQTQPAS